MNSQDPYNMKTPLMRLLHIVKMIFNVSCFYNTPERVASLLVKITNQVNIYRFTNWNHCILEYLRFFFKLTEPKDLSLYHKLWFSNCFFFATQCLRSLIFQAMNYVRLNNLSLKYQRLSPSSWKDISIRKSEFVTKTQFLWATFLWKLK